MAIVRLLDLRLPATVGVPAWERRQPTVLPVTVEFEYDTTAAAAADDLRRAVDYEALSAALASTAAAGEFRLVETLAAALLARVLAEPRVTRATVTVTKPDAVPAARAVQVEVSGCRPAAQVP